MLDRDHVRSFLPGLYPVGALMAIAPLADVLGAAWPMRPSDLAWRFGAIGLEFRAVLMQVAGLATLMAIAAVLGHRAVMRSLSIVAIIAAIALSAGVTRFILDFRLLNQSIMAPATSGLDVSAFRAVLAAILAVPVLTSLGGRGWVAGRAPAPAPQPGTGPLQVIPFRSRNFGRRGQPRQL